MPTAKASSSKTTKSSKSTKAAKSAKSVKSAKKPKSTKAIKAKPTKKVIKRPAVTRRKSAVKNVKPTNNNSQVKVKPALMSDQFNDMEQQTLLLHVGKIVCLRKRTMKGLGSLYAIEKVLDKYNQQFVRPEQKLEAIIKLGVEKSHTEDRRHFYVTTSMRSKEEDELYRVLSDMASGQVRFIDVLQKIERIYKECSNEK